MLTEIYIEAFLTDEKGADSIWEAWNAERISDAKAIDAWLSIAASPSESSNQSSPEIH